LLITAIKKQTFGTEGKFIHFAHGNGFPPASYTELLNKLGHHGHVMAMDQRPLWQSYGQKKPALYLDTDGAGPD
jgi:hypothetical protein